MTYVGFEERYYFGLVRLLEQQTPKKILLLHDSLDDIRVRRNFDMTLNIAEARGIQIFPVKISCNDYKTSLPSIRELLKEVDFNFESCLVDISTMPRDYILLIFGMIENSSGAINYVYNDPGYYDKGWLLSEYGEPVPVVGFSGIPDLENENCSIIITGFDTNLTEHLINTLESRLVRLGIQSGSKFNNKERNENAHNQIYGSNPNVIVFKIDAFSFDHGLKQIEEVVLREIETKNITICAVGPKLSLVALFRLQRKFPQVCISHVPSRRINKNYSSGIGRSYFGKIISQGASSLVWKWISSKNVAEELLIRCSALFTDHYGIWGENGILPGKPVRMPLPLLHKYISEGDNWIATASDKDTLIAYAICNRFDTPNGKISWISQLVVHRDYRHQGIAKQILNSIWGFSDHYAWGLATSSPYAIRALEKATRRRVVPNKIKENLDFIVPFVNSIFYLRDKEISVSPDLSVVNSLFFVDHANVNSQIEDVSSDCEWTLGNISDGQEWLAVTFRDQDQLQLTHQELSSIFANSDATVARAYKNMKFDENHAWTKHTEKEIDFIIKTFDISPGEEILDFGSGLGRHAIELAKRGYNVTCVDFVSDFIRITNDKAKALGLNNIVAIHGDCRTIKLDKQFDYAICLYDVIGSFPNDIDNNYILLNLSEHLNHDGRVLLSTMSLDVSAGMAKRISSVYGNPDVLLSLPPSSIMERSGNVFNPDYFIFDPNDHIFYRKEQFESGEDLPCELIVRDKRYNFEALNPVLSRTGISPVWHRYVQLGRWDIELPSSDSKAKELLIFATKGL